MDNQNNGLEFPQTIPSDISKTKSR